MYNRAFLITELVYYIFQYCNKFKTITFNPRCNRAMNSGCVTGNIHLWSPWYTSAIQARLLLHITMISRKDQGNCESSEKIHWPDLLFFSRPRWSCRALSLSARSADLLSRGFVDLSSRPLSSLLTLCLDGLCRTLWRSHSRTGCAAGFAVASLERDFAASWGDVCLASTRSRPPVDRSLAPRLSTSCDSVRGLAADPDPVAPPFFRNSNYNAMNSQRLYQSTSYK